MALDKSFQIRLGWDSNCSAQDLDLRSGLGSVIHSAVEQELQTIVACLERWPVEENLELSQ